MVMSLQSGFSQTRDSLVGVHADEDVVAIRKQSSARGGGSDQDGLDAGDFHKGIRINLAGHTHRLHGESFILTIIRFHLVNVVVRGVYRMSGR